MFTIILIIIILNYAYNKINIYNINVYFNNKFGFSEIRVKEKD